jgi:hypothetical protein
VIERAVPTKQKGHLFRLGGAARTAQFRAVRTDDVARSWSTEHRTTMVQQRSVASSRPYRTRLVAPGSSWELSRRPPDTTAGTSGWGTISLTVSGGLISERFQLP